MVARFLSKRADRWEFNRAMRSSFPHNCAQQFPSEFSFVHCRTKIEVVRRENSSRVWPFPLGWKAPIEWIHLKNERKTFSMSTFEFCLFQKGERRRIQSDSETNSRTGRSFGPSFDGKRWSRRSISRNFHQNGNGRENLRSIDQRIDKKTSHVDGKSGARLRDDSVKKNRIFHQRKTNFVSSLWRNVSSFNFDRDSLVDRIPSRSVLVRTFPRAKIGKFRFVAHLENPSGYRWRNSAFSRRTKSSNRNENKIRQEKQSLTKFLRRIEVNFLLVFRRSKCRPIRRWKFEK